MTELFYTITTNRGKEKIQEYYRESKTLPLTHMGFGGINGDEVNYQRPNVDMVQVPNEWTRINLERFPEEGFIGGGATIENRIEEYKGKWICNVGIYDEDGELILIAAYRPLLVDPEEAIVSSYPINIQTVLSNTEHVVVQTDTSITHPTHDEMNQALEELGSKLSKYATTDAAGLTELATQSEVDNRSGSDRVVTTQTLDKPGLINFLQK
ncbi:phage tail protein, partial [Vibrio sp. OPT18]|uniref:phage tail-collar fiber domain-containing protein n=1 Tax=Vibrio sp. OPT18 TaxID=2778641 RepID=UPI0018819B73